MKEATRTHDRAAPRRVALLSFLVLAHFIGAILHGGVSLAAVGGVPAAHAADTVVGSVSPLLAADTADTAGTSGATDDGTGTACSADTGRASPCPADDGANTDQRAGDLQVLLGTFLGALLIAAFWPPPPRSALRPVRRGAVPARPGVPLLRSLCIQRV
ncbi:hypothetical protein [Nocardiopsis suaedae]|uniref:Uncharacterized protein n=1 Tax=Nocardiopsis suaedae TaxID=3018444 RepID=A0ABT4TPD9_9ACTN|nr:hypothetical protein [Nocardiopsis suaedae]MDA2806256.1 hypothetical protein [Nocardiopsis suaedae]